MASVLNPYLNFRGQAREAMTFYQSVLGGDLTVSTFGDFGMEGADPAQVMHAQLKTPDGYTLMGADVPDHMPAPGAPSAISISGDDADTLRGFFAGLAEGGTVDMPLAQQPWGDEFGYLRDKFGVPWMVDIVPSHG